MKATSSVLKQKEFLILMVMLEHEEYQQMGLTSTNLVAQLIENKALWFKVGQVRDNKKFETSLKGDLSRLDQKLHYLKRNSSGRYVMGKDFDEGFQTLVSELYEYLEVIIEFQEHAMRERINRELIIKEIREGSIKYDVLSVNDDKKMNMLTDEQMRKLVEYSVKFRISI